MSASGPRREAIFLVAGDNARDWEGWYCEAIPLTDQWSVRHLADLETEKTNTL